MVVWNWLLNHALDLVQDLGIIGGFLFTGYSIHKERQAREIQNLIAIKQEHTEIWKQVYDRPKLHRVLKPDADLESQPLHDEEWLFVRSLIIHLDTVYLAKKAGLLLNLEGLERDIKGFFTLPIPSVVWSDVKVFQDSDFVAFVETCLASIPRGETRKSPSCIMIRSVCLILLV